MNGPWICFTNGQFFSSSASVTKEILEHFMHIKNDTSVRDTTERTLFVPMQNHQTGNSACCSVAIRHALLPPFPPHLGLKKLPDQQICMAKLTLRAGFHLQGYEKVAGMGVDTTQTKTSSMDLPKESNLGTNYKPMDGFEIVCQIVKMK